jgi:hypothetical protein
MPMIDVVDGDSPVREDILVAVKAGSSRLPSAADELTNVLPNPHPLRPERRPRLGGPTTARRQQRGQRERGNQPPHPTILGVDVAFSHVKGRW